MAKNTAKGTFQPKNPAKYKGKGQITFRSSWEFSVMKMLDEHPYIIAWQSESLQIPYYNPFKRAYTVYIPDFVIVYADGKGSGKQYVEMLEVKPLKETPGHTPVSVRTGKPLKVSQETKMAQALNYIKWEAARLYCRKMGWTFRVVTEQTLYNMNKK